MRGELRDLQAPEPLIRVLDDTTRVLATFSAVFFVVDPLAVVPLFIAMTPGDDARKRAGMAARACLVATAVLLAFAVGGQALFHLFAITLPAFRIASGILLLMTALEQLQSRSPPATRTTGIELAEAAAKDDISIVPLAMPLLAGPGAIATVMVLASESRTPMQTGTVIGSVLLTMALTWALLRVAERVDRFLGPTVRAILVRVTGLLLAAVGVQFILSALLEAFPGLASP